MKNLVILSVTCVSLLTSASYAQVPVTEVTCENSKQSSFDSKENSFYRINIKKMTISDDRGYDSKLKVARLNGETIWKTQMGDYDLTVKLVNESWPVSVSIRHEHYVCISEEKMGG